MLSFLSFSQQNLTPIVRLLYYIVLYYRTYRVRSLSRLELEDKSPILSVFDDFEPDGPQLVLLPSEI